MNKEDQPIDRRSTKDNYLRDRKKIKLVGPNIGVANQHKCPKCTAGNLAYKRLNEGTDDWYLVCNYSPMCSYTQKVEAPKADLKNVSIDFTDPEDHGAAPEVHGPLGYGSFDRKSKKWSGSKKSIDDDDIWSLFGTQGSVVSHSTHVYNSDSGWEQRE